MKSKHITFRANLEFYKKVKQAAKEEGCSVTELIIRALDYFINGGFE